MKHVVPVFRKPVRCFNSSNGSSRSCYSSSFSELRSEVAPGDPIGLC